MRPPGEPVAQTAGGLARIDRWVANPLVAYGAVLAIQLRILWRVWDYKDLTFGDTSSYFLDAAAWVHGLHDDIVWSPLYTDFLGTVVAVFHDLHTAVLVHRVAIVLAASLLVLAVMRRLLGPALGLVAAIWWAVLPANFDVAYEVHLFGVLPVLLAVLVVARSPGRRARGAALGILVASTLLVRNELLITVAGFAIALVIAELRGRRRPLDRRIGAAAGGPSGSAARRAGADRRIPLGALVRAYAIPLALAVAVSGVAYWRSFDQGSQAVASFAAKEQANFCQGYAVNWQQRYPSRFTGNPFLDCEPLVASVFGRRAPTLFQAIEANPRAVAAMAGWNALLIPSGVQVALFGATAGGEDPDYFPVVEHDRWALLALVGLVGVILTGLFTILREARREVGSEARGEAGSEARGEAGSGEARREGGSWPAAWWAQHRWAAILLGFVAVNLLVVALAERPAPEYIFGLSVGLIALTGLAVSAVLRRAGVMRFAGAAAGLLAIVALVASAPFYQPGPRPIDDGVVRTQVVHGELTAPTSVLLSDGYGGEICAYLGQTPVDHCTGVDWAALRARVAAGESLRAVLAADHVTAVYMPPDLEADPLLAPLATSPQSVGYRAVARGTAADGPWSVLVRVS
jgi:hypothetical protein